jgi:hypothetical protein
MILHVHPDNGMHLHASLIWFIINRFKEYLYTLVMKQNFVAFFMFGKTEALLVQKIAHL